MNFLIVLAELLSATGLTLLFIFFLLSEKVRREFVLMYLSNPKPGQFHSPKVDKTWMINNIVILVIVVLLVGSKFAVRYNEVKNAPLKEIPTVVEKAPEPVIVKMSAEVFYYCLDSARNKEGLKAEVINACKEAATIQLAVTEDNVKYTISKRDVVF